MEIFDGEEKNSKVSRKAGPKALLDASREHAALTGELPHEILLRAARGEVFYLKKQIAVNHEDGPKKGQFSHFIYEDVEYYPDYEQRIDAAKAAAPYYAPKLSSQAVSVRDDSIDKSGVIVIPMASPQSWESLAPEDQERLQRDVRK